MTTAERPTPLAGRVALVTGATRGVGRACAQALGQAGAHIIAVGRTQGALEDLDDALLASGAAPATLVPFDLTDGDAIDALGGAIFQRHGRLDILVHAAAMMGGLRPAAHIPPPLWDKVVATNLTSAFRLIRSLEPLLRAAPMGRAIFLTCEAARAPKAFWGSYAATKAGMEALVRAWADEVEISPLRVALVDPGPMRTRLRAEAYPGEDPETVPDASYVGPQVLALCLDASLGLPHDTVRLGVQEADGAPCP